MILSDFGGEPAPDLSLDQLKQMKEEQQMATKSPTLPKRKRDNAAITTAKPKTKPATANARVRKTLTEREALPDKVFEELGWDERITVYLDTKKEIAEMQTDSDFSPIKEAGHPIGNYEVTHIGSLRVDDNGRIFRVVKVEHVINANAKAT